MTEEEKRAMLAFLGNVHAQAKQTDQMIVGSSQYLKPVSQQIQQEFTNVYHSPTHIDHGYVQQQPVISDIQPTAVQAEQVIQKDVDHQMELPLFNSNNSISNNNTDQILDVLKSIDLNLKKIVTVLEFKNKPNARVKNPKKE